MTDHYAENDQHALALARRIVANLNWRKQGTHQLNIIKASCALLPSEVRNLIECCLLLRSRRSRCIRLRSCA